MNERLKNNKSIFYNIMFPETLFPPRCFTNKVRAVWSLKCERFSIKIHETSYFNKLCKEVLSVQFSSVQLLSCVRLFATPWVAACQASLSNSKEIYLTLLNPTFPKYSWPGKLMLSTSYYQCRDFPGGPVVDSMLPLQGAQVWTLVEELRILHPRWQWPKKKKAKK